MKSQNSLKNTMLIFEGQLGNTSMRIQPLKKLLTKNMQSCYLSPWTLKIFRTFEKVSTMWVKNLNKIVKNMNNTKSSMIDMKPKDAIKQDIIPLEKTYPG